MGPPAPFLDLDDQSLEDTRQEAQLVREEPDLKRPRRGALSRCSHLLELLESLHELGRGERR